MIRIQSVSKRRKTTPKFLSLDLQCVLEFLKFNFAPQMVYVILDPHLYVILYGKNHSNFKCLSRRLGIQAHEWWPRLDGRGARRRA